MIRFYFNLILNILFIFIFIYFYLFLFSQEEDGFCIAKGQVIPKERFLEQAKVLYNREKSMYDLKRYFYQRNNIFPRLEQAKTFTQGKNN